MNVKELKEKYGCGKKLTSLRRKDFTSFNTLEETVYKGIQVRIELDRYNNHWIYSSDYISLCGRYDGTITELKEYIKYKINDYLKNKKE